MAENLALILQKVKAGQCQLSKESGKMIAFLDQLSDVAALEECKAQAAAIAEYVARKKDLSVDEHNAAVTIAMKVAHRLGEVLTATVRPRGRTSSGNGALPEPITKMQSSRTQQLARMSWQTIQNRIEDRTAKNERVSQARIVREFHDEETAKERKRLEKEALAVAEASERYYQVECADCLQWFAAQEADSIDLVFGSPPYEQARLYLENGEDKGIALSTEKWVAWMVQVYRAALRCCKGLVAFVVEGQTKNYRWSAAPALLMADLHRAGIHLRKPPIYYRVGIPGSGGPDWLRNDYEYIVCATRGGELPWSDNTAMGEPPRYEPGGNPSHRTKDGSRVSGYASMQDRANVGPHRARQKAGRVYEPPAIANPGNVVECIAGGGNMGDKLCHENEAPFPEDLPEFFIRSFCPKGGVVCDPFCGSGTTGKVALEYRRRFLGCDIRSSQVRLTQRRLAAVQKILPLEI